MPPSNAFFYSVRERCPERLLSRCSRPGMKSTRCANSPHRSLLSARDKIDQMRELSAQVFAGQPVHETVRHFRRDGKFLEIEINAVPLRRGGRVQGAYAIYNNVSERAKAEEEAKKH